MPELHFVRPLWLAALPVVLWLTWRLYRLGGTASAWRAACDPALLAHLLSGAAARPARGPYVALAGSFAVAVVALAGPAWQHNAQAVERTLDARVIVLDLSRSMDAPDLKPSRLARARFKVADVLNRSREGQTGLVAVAGDAFVVSPLTSDANTVKAMLPALGTAIMPIQGSRVDRGLKLAATLLRRAGTPDGEVLLVSDGVADEDAALAAAQALRDQGARLSVLAVGTREGAPIARATGGFVKDRAGNIVIPRLDPERLRRLAEAGGGGFALITADDSDLDRVLPRHKIPTHTRRVARRARLWREQGPWLVALLLPLAALAFRRGWLLVLVLAAGLPARPAAAFGWNDLWSRPDQRAARALAAGDAEGAAQASSDADWRGSALYRARRYADAARAFAQAAPDDALADYNRGNALARAGKLKQAVTAYDEALARDPGFADATHNRDLVRRLVQQHRAPKKSTGGSKEKKGRANRKGDHNSPRRGDKGTNRKTQKSTNSGAAARAGDKPSAERKRSGQAQQQQDRPAKASGRTPGARNRRDAAKTAREPSIAKRDGRSEKASESAAKPAPRDTARELARAAERRWLRRIPDDPGGLLRRKFALELERRGGQVQTDGQAW